LPSPAGVNRVLLAFYTRGARAHGIRDGQTRTGTSHLVFDPIEFMEKLAAITPRPAVNLVIYHGVLAPRARWRAAVVRYGRPEPDAIAPTADARLRGAWTWAALMHRVFALDVLACPRCGGPRRIVGTVTEPEAVRRLLGALGLAAQPPPHRSVTAP
jgi:hypothetical protein